ncbi:DEKNAAC101684 [Brettanomyces naardenensis]|uniref:DEKNAAC101684 n=1 Tax=Brettanomyces naardenensis TaxID=13370 RepID=A0A448YJ18_BRENA|nr:DEKNAAC101684 [Brettanomyces naardenensis]
MSELITSPLFPVEGLSSETLIKLPTKPNAASGSVKLYIIFAEPRLFLEGFTDEEIKERPPAVLRGCLFIRILKPVRIKTVTLKLQGVARTDWPEGIPPRKVEHMEANTVLNHTWSFFNHNNTYPVTDHSRKNADLFVPKAETTDIESLNLDSTLSPVSSTASEIHSMKSPSSFVNALMGSTTSNSNSPHGNLRRPMSPDPELRPSISHSSSRLTVTGSHHNSEGDNKLFAPGDYIYSFEQLFPSNLPESMSLTFGSVHYIVEASVERSGAFKTNLYARRPVSVIRTPSSASSEENEPIVINRDWEDRLHYEIIISSKQVILNSFLPISFKLTPLDKIQVHRLRIYITEHLEYLCHDKHVHRAEPPKKVLLLEHRPPAGVENLLSIGDDEIGGAQMDFQVYIPEYYGERFRLHPDTCFDDIQSHHWIKICVRLSKAEPTPEDPKKRKHYELSIDSPIHILSQHCAHANTLLPSYEEQIQEDDGLRAASNNAVDMNMIPRTDMILDSNMYHPDTAIPVEMLSPQAKPFSPLVSPELNAINPELRYASEMKPIDLLKTLSTVTPPPAPISGPPPPFQEHDGNPPPTYEEALKNSSSSESSTTSYEGGRMEVQPSGRSRKERSSNAASLIESQRESSSADLGDMDGRFHLKVIPIRSRSPSGSPPPNFAQGSSRSRLVSSSLVPGLHFHSHGLPSSPHAIDAALASSLDANDDDEQHLSQSPRSVEDANEGSSSSPMGERDHTLSHSSTSTLTPTQSLAAPTAVPQVGTDGYSDGSLVAGHRLSSSSTDSAHISLQSDDQIIKQPLLDNGSSDGLVPPVYSTSINHSNNSFSLRNGSIATDLNFARDPDSSIDISSMFGSTLDRSSNPINPVGFDLADSSSSPMGTPWRPFSFAIGSSAVKRGPLCQHDEHGPPTVGLQPSDESKGSDQRQKHIGYGIQPIMGTLANPPSKLQ